MPGTDLGLEQLREYRGSYPAPEDFREFWKKAKRRVEQASLEVEQEKIHFEGQRLLYFKITVKALDGALLRAKYICPDKEGVFPVAVHFHDYPGASKGWFYLGRYAALGWSVLAPDCRGQGGESEAGAAGKGPGAYGPLFSGLEDTVEHMYLYRLLEDSLLWIRVLKTLPSVDKENISVYGEGQGGGLSVACAAMYEEIQKCAVHYPMLCDYKRVWDKDFDSNGYEGLNYFFRWHDPLHEREKEIFDKLAYVDVKNFAPYVKGQVLMSTGLQDRVSPPSAQFALFHGLECKKSHLVYPKHGHELNNFFENEYLRFLLRGL